MSTFDEPDAKEVFQTDDYGPLVVPVHVPGVVRVDEMPTNTYYLKKILKAGSNAELILGADPRRKRVIFWVIPMGTGSDVVCISDTQGDVQAFQGADLYINSPGLLRYEDTSKNQIWVRPAKINTTSGIIQSYAVTTTDVVLSMFVEQWAH